MKRSVAKWLLRMRLMDFEPRVCVAWINTIMEVSK